MLVYSHAIPDSESPLISLADACFDMNIAMDGDNYIISISTTLDGDNVEIYYKGEMEIIDEPAEE